MKIRLMPLKHVSEEYEENEFKRRLGGMTAHLSKDYEDFKFQTRP